MTDLFQPVWPLEIAKCEYLVYRATLADDFRRRYIMTGIRSMATALVQTWWALETLINDVASIIAKERAATLDAATVSMLQGTRPGLDKAGAVVTIPYYQPILDRMQFVYRLLTQEELDRRGSEWRCLAELKDARDAYVHRLGKDGENGLATLDSVIADGFGAVRSVLARVFTKTPEFANRFCLQVLGFLVLRV